MSIRLSLCIVLTLLTAKTVRSQNCDPHCQMQRFESAQFERTLTQRANELRSIYKNSRQTSYKDIEIKALAGLLELFYQHTQDFDSVLLYARLLNQSSDLLSNEQRIQTLRYQGLAFQQKGAYDSSQIYLEEALKLNPPETRREAIRADLVFTLTQQRKYREALHLAKMTLDLAVQRGDNEVMARQHQVMASLHEKLGNANMAMHHKLEASKLGNKVGLKEPEKVIDQIGRLADDIPRSEQGEEQIRKAIENADNPDHKVALTVNLAKYFNDNGRFAEALKLLDLEENLIAQTDDFIQTTFYLTKGRALLGLGSNDQAERVFIDANSLVNRTGDLKHQFIVNRALQRLHAVSGRNELSAEFAYRGDSIQRKLKTEETLNAINEVEDKYVIAQRDFELSEANEQKNLLRQRAQLQLWLAVSVVFLVILIGWFLWYRRKKIRQMERLEVDQLKAMDEMKSRFFANVAHELKTPLTLIYGPAIDASRQEGLEKQLSQTLDMIGNNARKMLGRVEEIMALSKIEADKLVLKPEPVCFPEFVKKLAKAHELASLANAVKIDLISTLPTDLVLMVDTNKLEKILDNLLSNAIKFSPYDSTVRLVVEETHDSRFVKMMVVDEGKGISAEDLPYVFDRYYQAKDSEASSLGGTGIGLALASELTALMDGRITVKSELGKGSVFTLLIPLIKGAMPSQEEVMTSVFDPETDRPKQKSKGTRCEIMLVEDHVEMRHYIRSVLQEDFNICEAANGKEALEKLNSQKYHPQLIISDIMMPEMDGLTLLDKLKSDDRYLDLPVIMLTARSDEQDKLQALVQGVDDYMTKPFNGTELRARVSNLLRYKRNRAEIQTDDETKGEPAMTLADRKWLKEMEELLTREVGNTNFGLGDLAEDLAMSERNIRRKIKKLTGFSPNHYIRLIKLTYARQLMERGDVRTMSEAAHQVGFTSARHFSDIFYEHFGKRPADVLSELG